ncbi:MAG: MBL fold metallo-hydrolase, partial [Gemmatimonadales bacterium]|nr:MBL fold metallo-hydrolase [Gemmatimonadales bacterium]
MQHYICATCGVQYPESASPPDQCVVCEDERQYVGWEGQEWTTLDALRGQYRNRFDPMEPGLTRIGMEPTFAIGQHAYLVEAPDGGGNILWDCISLIDLKTIARVQELGGLSGIALSHPHYYSSIVEWSRAFDGIPIYINAADRHWVVRPDPAIVFWEGKTRSLGTGLTLIHGGGHFDGGAMLHWNGGAEGRGGALLPGDIIQVVHDRRWVSFMYSYVNYIPLPAAKVKQVAAAVEP